MVQTCTLSLKQTSLLTALLAGATIEDAAKCANISRRTAYNLYNKTEFQTALNEAKDELFQKELQSLKLDVGLALKTLRRNMGEKVQPSGTQVRAAAVWLSTAIELHKLDTIEAKIEELQALLQGAM